MIDATSDNVVPPAADTRRPQVLRRLLTATVAVAVVMFAWSITTAILAQVQSDYLGNRSEASGGFDPTVFPPFDVLTWLMAIAAPLSTGSLLVLTITARIVLQRSIARPFNL
ncbi:hypothetical protein ACO2Q7_13675 [Rathayibacter sp. KR2-224]|uniref:hypothetical protein n=1 Tax=Rathayibacter sp. KR2-224 TaxID=3400913 RepID=UPI003C05DD22